MVNASNQFGTYCFLQKKKKLELIEYKQNKEKKQKDKYGGI